MPLFSYQIVPGGGTGQVLATGSLYIVDVERAKRYVQTVIVHGLFAVPGMQVILQDQMGTEIWRGPYLGADKPHTSGA